MPASLPFSLTPKANPTSEIERKNLLKNPGFGQIFTDHMAVIDWSQEKGWHDARITARQPFSLDPATSVLHYSQEIFEGLKAYRGDKGQVVLFRPEQNARRFQRSAKRLAMPSLPEEDFIAAIEGLLRLDKDWIPTSEGGSLYLRPFMFASESFLGVRPAHNYIFCVIASPVESYFKGGGKPVTVWIETQASRAAPGGTGAAKCGGNYAASLETQKLAIEKGCDQVVFLDAIQHKFVEELGGMNICFIFADNTLVTPPFSGTILEGITCESILTLAQDMGLHVEQRPYSFDEWQNDVASGNLREVFACGTAAVISPIGKVCHAQGEFVIGDGEAGPLSRQLRQQLMDIQYGRGHDLHHWMRQVAV